MPRPVSPKKHRLTLAQLSAYDDILTDALVDHVYFWTTIRKNKTAYHHSRGITEEAVTSILQRQVIVETEPARAVVELLALPSLKKFSDSLRTDAEKKDFQDHLRKYVNIYMTDCPWEVSTTNRYTVVTQEAAVTARRDIKKGEVIKYLCGVQVQLSEDEEDIIKSSAKDFSIVVSSRSRTASLFLGPARFANHDCNANARLKTTGTSGMEIVAYQNIDEGEEVTVSYGENYFGEDNCECLCRTCESLCRNGWTAPENHGIETAIAPKQSIESANGDGTTYSLRRRRQVPRDSAYSRSPSMTPDLNIRPRVSKRTPRSLRFKATNSPLGKSPSVDPNNLSEVPSTPSKRKRELENLQPTPSKKRAKTGLSTEVKIEGPTEPVVEDMPTSTLAPSINSASPSPSPSSIENHTATDATSVDEDDTIVVEPRVINAPVLKMGKTRGSMPTGLLEQADAGESILVDASTSAEHPAVVDGATAVLADLESAADETNSKIPTPKFGIRRRKRKQARPISDKDHAPAIRHPGDYVLTPALLSEPAMSWIVCKICEEPFVQQNAYFTRSACPRCERHSKLYGYCWPKTDKEDSEDDEERVLDHRTIHRFIKPAEEKSSRKLAKESTGLDSRADTRDASEAVKNTKGSKIMKNKKRKDVDEETEQEAEASPGRRSSRKRVKRD